MACRDRPEDDMPALAGRLDLWVISPFAFDGLVMTWIPAPVIRTRTPLTALLLSVTLMWIVVAWPTLSPCFAVTWMAVHRRLRDDLPDDEDACGRRVVRQRRLRHVTDDGRRVRRSVLSLVGVVTSVMVTESPT